MKKFERIDSYNKKYTAELNRALETIMPTLIEAFIRIFGEKHREYITYTLTNINFVFFIPEGYFKVLLDDRIGIRKKDLAIIKYYLQYINHLNHIFQSIPKEEQEDFIFKYFITRIDLKDNLKGQILFALEEDCALATHILKGQDLSKLTVEKVVLLPIFALDFKIVVHELTHTLLENPVGFSETELLNTVPFLNDETGELINDYIASRVLEEYKNLGGFIPYCLRRFKFNNIYEDLDILVSYFYDSLSPLILESTITGNHNKLWLCAGSSFPEFCEKVEELFTSDKDIVQEDYDILCDYVDQMEDNIFRIKETDYETFYQELESMGYRVRKIKSD